MYNDNVMTMKGAEEDDMKEDVGSTAQCSGGENEDDKMPGGCFFLLLPERLLLVFTYSLIVYTKLVQIRNKVI